MAKPKVIAFYLPQYHPTPHNDEWWGKGFTEWTNVARAKPLFRGHEQPHIPGELGFYDLRLPQVREAQAELAKEYGIYGFCYYYYRFEKGKNELELPINEVLKSGKPDFPFMICWANQTWHKKFWRYDGTSENLVLVEQKYGGKQDYIDFFYEVLPFFKDKRYIKIEDKPAFMIHKPKEFPEVSEMVSIWNELARKEGLNGVYFIGYINGNVNEDTNRFFQKVSIFNRFKNMASINVTDDMNNVISKGMDAVAANRQYHVFIVRNKIRRILSIVMRKLFHRPKTIEYKEVINYLKGEEDKIENVFPIVLPNWDHTPRSLYGGEVFVNSTPDLFQKYLYDIFESISRKDAEHQIVFIKAWNEWGEGNYMEPDIKWGRKYLEAVKYALNEFEKNHYDH
ncbi:MAG: glycoside hydrolase family 99-like domain-containing protein [Bacteroidales bacterium]|nr:glycoside hydrolase family 99-like domain-containing protein [Bacteroidales bacterium]